MLNLWKHPLLWIIVGLVLAYVAGGLHGYIYAIDKYSVQGSRVSNLWSHKP